MNIPLIASLAAVLFWGVGDFLIQRTARKIGDVESLAWIGIIGSIGLLPFVWKDLALLGAGGSLLLLGGLGVITFGAALVDLEALRIGKLSVIDMVLTLELPFTILLALLFFKESLTLWQVVLILFLMWGVAFIGVTRNRIAFTIERGVWLAVIAAFGMALVNFLTALSAREVSVLLAVWIPWIIFTILCLGVLWRRDGLHGLSHHFKQQYTLIIAMGIFDTLAWLTYALATKHGEVSSVTAVTEAYPALALLLGVWVNREHITLLQYVGAFVALTAAVLLSLTL